MCVRAYMCVHARLFVCMCVPARLYASANEGRHGLSNAKAIIKSACLLTHRIEDSIYWRVFSNI